MTDRREKAGEDRDKNPPTLAGATRAPRRRPIRGRLSGSRSLPTVLGLPVTLLALGLAAAAVVGLLLANALEISTSTRAGAASGSVDGTTGAGNNSSGIPVITENTLGVEVQRLVDTGAIQTAANFDVTRCLEEQGITDTVVTMEEVQWRADGPRSWLIIHGPTDRETLRANGGAINATVVLDTCGTTRSDGADETRLWSGSTMIGGV